MGGLIRVVIAFLGTLGAAGSGATVRVGDARALREALARAGPGTVVAVAPGEYRGYFSARGLHGAPDAPIVVQAADPGRPPVFRGASECLHLSNVSYLVLRNLVFVGARVNGLNIDDGGTITLPSHHLVLDGLRVRDVGPRGNRDGIKLSGVDDFLMVNCAVERWGSGGSAVDMVGCHRGLIADCRFENTPGRGASGVQAKGGSANVVVYRCLFRHAGARAINMGGSTGRAFFRPPRPGYEARRIAAVGNTIVGSLAPVAFVGCEDCRATYNTIYRPRGWVLRILQESRGPDFVPSRNGLFAHNLVVWRWRELRATVNIGPATAPETFRFADNWWWCEGGPTMQRFHLPTKEEGGVYGRDPRLERRQGRLAARATRDHGAHARAASEEFAAMARKMVPWAFEVFSTLSRRPADQTPRHTGRP